MRLPIPSVKDFGLLIIVIALFVGVDRNLLQDGDAFYHIRAGQWMIQHKTLPTPDPFSYGMNGKEIISLEWMSDIVSGIVYEAFGLDGFCLMYLGILSLAFFLLLNWAGRRWGILSTFLTLLLFYCTSLHWLARPHLWTYLFMVLYLIGLDRWLGRERISYWFFPTIMAAWVNLHGGYMVGFALLGITFVHVLWDWMRGGRTLEDRSNLTRMGIIILLTLAASFLNPYGPAIWTYTLKFIGDSSTTRNVQEFLSPNFREDWLLLIAYLFIIGPFIVSRQRPSVSEVLRLAFFGAMSLQAVRHVPLFAFVMTDAVGRRIRAWIDGPGCPIFLRNRLAEYDKHEASSKGFWSGIIFIVSVVVCMNGYDFKPNPKLYPTEAIQYLREHPMSGDGFNTDELGDNMIWELWPEYKVYVYGRLDYYEGSRLDDYYTLIYLGPNTKEVLERSQFKWVFVDNSPLERHLSARADWEKVYADSKASIFVKREG